MAALVVLVRARLVEQYPSYVFPEAGDYAVTMLARNADQEDDAEMTLQVLEAAVAIPAFDPDVPLPTTAPAPITFVDQSTADDRDPIVEWFWDFAGWGTSSLQDPDEVTIGQAGTWVVRLTITTQSGRSDTQTLEVVLD